MSITNRKHVWLHIGMPKTGTTSLQTVLYKNRDRLSERGYFYPDFGDRQHVAMARMLAQRAGSKIPFPKVGSCPDTEKFSEYLDSQAPGAHSVILSTENLFQRPGSVAFSQLYSPEEGLSLIRKTAGCVRDYLAGMDVSVVMWLRRQDNWLMSIYNETIKTSLYRGDLWSLVDNVVGTHFFDIVSIWVDTFGRDNVHCYSYDRLIAEGRDIVDEFVALTGLRETLGEYDRNDVQDRSNPALSAEALELKVLINEALSELPPAARNAVNMQAFRKVVRNVSTRSPKWPHAMLSPQQRKQLMARYMAGNVRLVEELGYTHVSDICDITDLNEMEASADWQPWQGGDMTAIRELIALALSQSVRIHQLNREKRKASSL